MFEVFLLEIFLAEELYNELLRSMESHGNMAGLCFVVKTHKDGGGASGGGGGRHFFN